jgi:hypothetical protein
MKIKNWLLFSLITIALFFGCSESDSVTEPEKEKNYTEEISEFFPVNVGDSFLYNVDTLNQTTNEYNNIGSRLTNVYKVEEVSGQSLFICNEDFNILGNKILAKSKFQLTSNSLEFFVDTTGVSALIPDSIEIEIELALDETFKVLEFPLVKNQTWNVFSGSANFGTFKFKVFEIYGEYITSETLQLDGSNNSLETEKIKYSVSINIPDIANPFVSKIQEYEAYVWFSPGFGVVKIEGCQLFIDPMTGNGFDIAGSNKVVRHSLVSQ